MVLPSIRATLLSFAVFGLAWPLGVTGLSQVLFPGAANGSIVSSAEGPVGSALLGQAFHAPGYLQGRPAAANYDPAASSGSNLGPSNPALAERREKEKVRLEAENPLGGPVPEILLTASGSGLDPHIPPEAARYQVPRIAAARAVEPARVAALVDELVEEPFLGEPQVNVLLFNLALDRRWPPQAQR